ncbi:MAG TPA: ABC transporter permease [Candidatus Eisenbacteria bacterium]|nr:ABC transporter permease [Candidatus Eisenbacteria bacterium]
MTPLRAPRRDFWLTLGENLRIAVRALRANKMRTVLTIIGNVVAVMSVIAVVSIIDGVNTYVSEKVLDQGLRVIYIDKFGLITDEEEWRLAQRRRDLTLYEMEALEARMRLARRVVGQVQTSKSVRARGTELKNVRIYGTTEGYPDVGKYEMAEGRELDASDFERRRPVAVIGSEVAEKLFPYVDPVGQSLRVSGHDLRVVGILAARGNVLGQSQDNIVLIPMGQFTKMYGSRESLTILVSGQEDVSLDRLEDEARVVLRSARHVPLGKPDDFAISTAETYMALYQTLTSGIFAGTIGLVAISLVVGGIVIMNIMLVAVTERTREIGIRKAVGARRADLVSQFLSEAVVLALLGGVVGVLAGVSIALLIRAVTPLPATIQPWSVAISLAVASSVGLFFGVYPATRAAKLDPIVALRQE